MFFPCSLVDEQEFRKEERPYRSPHISFPRLRKNSSSRAQILLYLSKLRTTLHTVVGVTRNPTYPQSFKSLYHERKRSEAPFLFEQSTPKSKTPPHAFLLGTSVQEPYRIEKVQAQWILSFWSVRPMSQQYSDDTDMLLFVRTARSQQTGNKIQDTMPNPGCCASNGSNQASKSKPRRGQERIRSATIDTIPIVPCHSL